MKVLNIPVAARCHVNATRQDAAVPLQTRERDLFGKLSIHYDLNSAQISVSGSQQRICIRQVDLYGYTPFGMDVRDGYKYARFTCFCIIMSYSYDIIQIRIRYQWNNIIFGYNTKSKSTTLGIVVFKLKWSWRIFYGG